tara:strand:+ start:88 stop:336 length:249 start_codon:yes stop_codon:yes gene_type:complete
MAGPKNRKKLNKDLVTYNGKRMHYSTAEGLQMQGAVSRGETSVENFQDYLYVKGFSEGDLSESQKNKLYEKYIQEKNGKFMK